MRRRFQSLFLFCQRVRELCLNRVRLNGLVWAAVPRSHLRSLLINIVLGNRAVPENISLKKVLFVMESKVLYRLALLASLLRSFRASLKSGNSLP